MLVYFQTEAEQEILEAEEYWSTRNPGLFQEELDRALSLISSHPGIGEPYPHPTLPGVRRRLLRKTGFYLYYRPDPSRPALQVLALRSVRRGQSF